MGSLDLGYGAVPPDYGNISYSGGIDTITIDASNMYSSGSISLPTTTITNGGYTIGSAGTSGQVYTTTGTGHYNWNSTTPNTVHINTDGLTMAEGTDITVGGKSLTKAIEQIEERLGILHPNPALEERWDKLKDLRRQYIEMEKDLLEKEKIMKILKES
jgi:hypothetical protein